MCHLRGKGAGVFIHQISQSLVRAANYCNTSLFCLAVCEQSDSRESLLRLPVRSRACTHGVVGEGDTVGVHSTCYYCSCELLFLSSKGLQIARCSVKTAQFRVWSGMQGILQNFLSAWISECNLIWKYSHTSVLVGFRIHQTLYLLHFDKKKVFQHSALAWDLALLLELMWVMMPPRKRKCFMGSTHWFRHSSWVLEWINKHPGAAMGPLWM